MSLIEEARNQLEAEVFSYIRSAQQPFNPVLPPFDESLNSLGVARIKKSAVGSAVVATEKAPKGSTKGTKDAAATTVVSSTTHNRTGNQKQGRAKLMELVKKLQRAAFIKAQVSKDEVDGGSSGDPLLSRCGSRMEGGLSRHQSTLSFASTIKPTCANPIPLPNASIRSASSNKSAVKKNKGLHCTTAETATAAFDAAVMETRADTRGVSPRTSRQPSIAPSLTDTHVSQSLRGRNLGTERSHSTVTSLMGQDRSRTSNPAAGVNSNNGAAAAANALRRLEASLMFTQDCLHYAATFAEAGLTHEAQTCFLQPIAHEITNTYEPIVVRCVERQPSATARQQQQQSQHPQQRDDMAAVTPAQALRRRRVSKGKAARENQKRNPLSPKSPSLSGQPLTSPISPTAPSLGRMQNAESAAEDQFRGVRMTDKIDVFASDVPLPLALQVYKSVLRYHAVQAYIRFQDALQADGFGDAAGMSTSAAACACVEELVAHQQQVLNTMPFSAASIILAEETRIKEDVTHTAAAKSVSAIVVAGGCKLVDLLAEPALTTPNVASLSLTSFTDDPTMSVYAVEEVAAPVLLTMRLYVARMCERLLAYIRSTTAGEMAQVCSEPCAALTQRCLNALRASVSMSELHLGKTTVQSPTEASTTSAAESKTHLQQQPQYKTCLPLASVEYLPWRLQEYTLLQHGYLQLENGTAAAVAAAEHALQQVLQLAELEYLDPVPPPTSTVVTLDAAVQQCAGWLLVATWRAAVAQSSSSVNNYLGLPAAASEVSTVPSTPEAIASNAQSPTASVSGGVGGDIMAGGDPPVVASFHMSTTTARTALTAITAAVQQAVAFLLTAQWTSTSAGGLSVNLISDMTPRRVSRKGGPNSIVTGATVGGGGLGFGGDGGGGDGTSHTMNGTRLLIVLWAYIAQVQQQCTLLAGRTAVAEALAAAAKETEYTEAPADDAEVGDGGPGGKSPGHNVASPPPGGASPKSAPSRAPAQRKANAKGKATGNSTLLNATVGDSAALVGDAAATGSGAVSPSLFVPAELRHAHPAVAALASQFPRLALDLILRLVGVVEATGAVPQAPPFNGRGSSDGDGKKRSTKNGDGAQDGAATRRFNDAVERRFGRGARRRASSVAIGCGDSPNSSFTPFGGATASYAMTVATAVSAFQRRALQCVYRGCVEALEVLLHAAAVKSTTAESTGGEGPQSFSPLSVLTRATVWNDTVEVLGYCDEMETEVDVAAARCGALHDGQPTLSPRYARFYSPPAATATSNGFNSFVCFLYNPADTRCVHRWISWDVLFSASDGDATNVEKGGAGGVLFTPKSLVEAAAVRAMMALRTIAFASPRFAVAVRVGLAMESWWRAQLSSVKKSVTVKAPGKTATAVVGEAAKKGGTTTTVSALRASSSSSVECAIRCVQLLRALLLALALHQNQSRQEAQPQQPQQQQSASIAQKESPLTSVLRLFEDAACTLDVLAPLSKPSTESSSPPGEVCQPSESATSPNLSSLPLEVRSAVDDYVNLAAQAQASVQLSTYQRRTLRTADGRKAIALREYFEWDEASETLTDTGETWTPLPSSMCLYKVIAVLVAKMAAALCPTVDASQKNNNTNGFSPPWPSFAALLLQPIAIDAGNFLLRCSEALRAQWQQQRTRRLLQRVGHNVIMDAAANSEDAAVTAIAGPYRAQEQLEASEEAHYATIVWCVLSFLWNSGGRNGAPQLDERGVAAVARRASTGFLQLLPSGQTEGDAATTTTSLRIPPVQLSHLLAHGVTVRRLLELTRAHFQDHVESLLRHSTVVAATGAMVASHGGGSGHARIGHAPPLKISTSVTAAQQASQHRALVAVRDGLTELTHTWVTVRWHLARLQTHHAEYTARHVDLETLQQRHDQYQIYGRPSAKELRILQTLEQDAPLLPTTAKDEEVHLKRWVKDQQHAAAGTALATSSQLLEALVCAALVPLNTADPSAQQKLVDEAVRALTDAEKSTGNEVAHRPNSSGANKSTASQQQQQQQALRQTKEPLVIYTPLLLWCYLAEACSRCGTAEQVALVRDVLDHHLLTETPESSSASAAGAALTTAPFVQKLLLQPRWAVLDDCSLTTRLAFCRALSALASHSTLSMSALSSLQSAYRLLLVLQIQQLTDLSAGTAVSSRVDKNDTAGFGSGNSDSAQRHSSASKATLSSAQQLLSSITDYIARSAATTTSPSGSPAAPLLLPLLAELCNVLLRLPASSPQWTDGDIQLFALRVLILFKQQQLALLTASPSPLTVGVAISTTTAATAANTAGVMMDALRQLLWATFAHVWNSVFRNPNPRQRRVLQANATRTQWARRVFDHHLWQTQLAAAAEQDDGSGEHGNEKDGQAGNRCSRSAPHRRGNGSHPSPVGGAPAPDTTSSSTPPVVDHNVAPLNFSGVTYLPEDDGGQHHSHHDEEQSAAAVNDGGSPERHRASTWRPRTGVYANSHARGYAASLPTVFLHDHMPCEYMELLEDVLFHLPSLWMHILSPPGPFVVPAVAAALDRSSNDSPTHSGKGNGRSPSPHSPTAAAESEGASSRMQTQYDFVCYAALQAAQILRESQRSANSSNGAMTGEPRASAAAASTVGGQLYGLPPIYMEIVAALQRYSVAMSNSGAASGTSNLSGAQQQGTTSSSGGAAAAAAALASSGSRGNNARTVNNSGAVPAVSAAGLALMDTLNKYKEDPNYAKVAMHVVREMLAFCTDDCPSVSGALHISASGSANTTVNNRKKNAGGGGGMSSAAGATESSGSGGITGRTSAGVSAAAVTADVRHIIHSVREQAHENYRAIRGFLASVSAETEAWLTHGGFTLAGQVQQQQSQSSCASQSNGASRQLSSPRATAEADAGSGGKSKATAATTQSKKKGKRGNKRGSGGKSKRVNANGNKEEDSGEEDGSRDDAAAELTGVLYTKVARTFSFIEEQKLKQLTCAVARWRRSCAARTLRQRYVQFNTPFLAQMHLIEAALLHMGATVQREAERQRRVMQKLLALTEGKGGDAQAETTTAATGSTNVVSSLRGLQREKKATGGGPPPPTKNRDGADMDGPSKMTEEILRHCACASNLFQNLWLPARASAAVQLAVSHLQEAPLSIAPSSFMCLSSSPSQGAATREVTFLTQLLTVPLFSIAAVQRGYYDARRDVHNCVLQPPVIKVGAEVSFARQDDFVCAVPSLLTLTSAMGQRGEHKMARHAGTQVKKQRRFELLQLSWCVEEEAETRAEAIRDELQGRVRILQQAQQQLQSSPAQAAALKARLVSAADLLALLSEKRRRAEHLMNSVKPNRIGDESLSSAAQPNLEAVYAAAASASDSLLYSPFEGVHGGLATAQSGSGDRSRRQPAGETGTTMRTAGDNNEAASFTTVDAACYGRDMSEANLIGQLISLAHTLEPASPNTCAAAYRVAQQLTNGRYATELLPHLLKLEESEGCRCDASGATLQVYEKALRSVSDGVWLLHSARSVRRQLSASPCPSKSTVRGGGAQSATSSTFVCSAVSWKNVVEAYHRAAQALRSAGCLHLLGECLYELGNLYCTAGRIKEAERNWLDALDCFLSTPHVFDDWHTQRSVPPPLLFSSSSSSSTTGRRGVEELVWMTAALTSLAEHAYATNAARATDAHLLCALLIHESWRLPAVVEGGANSAIDAAWSSSPWHSTALPCSEYNQLDVASLCTTTATTAYGERKTRSGGGGGSLSQRSATQMPDALSGVVRAIIHAAHLLVQQHFSSEAAVLGAFSDFMATIHLQQVELTVEARLVRATAAADLGSFAVSMRHIHSVCIGAGLPQPVRGVLGMDSFPGYYSIASAMAATTACAARSQASSNAQTQGRKPAAGTGATTVSGGGTVSGGSGGGPISAAAVTSVNGGAVALSTAATVLPASVSTLFYFYRDHESPSSLHNTAAIRAFVLACLPGLSLDAALSVSGPTSRIVAALSTLPLVGGGLLASAALESRYGVCLLRQLCVAIAEVLVRLGTCDPVYLFRSPPPSLLSRSRVMPQLGAGGSEGSAFFSAAPLPATVAVSSATSSASGGGNPSLFPSLLSASSFPPLATGERPTNACTEACRYAQVLLSSLRNPDVKLALVGQSSALGIAVAGDAGEETDGAASSRTTRASGEVSARARGNTNAGNSGRMGSDPTTTTTASVLVQGVAGETARDSASQSAEGAGWLDMLGAISQWAVFLTGEVLAAQGLYRACLQLLTSTVAEYNDVQASPPTPGITIESLRGYGFQGTRGGSNSNGPSLPFSFTYVHWMRVWQLICRCYSALRHYTQLEIAAGTQGLRMCDAFGDTTTHRRVFQLYRLYALTQMGRLTEAADVAADLQRAVAPFTAALEQKKCIAAAGDREVCGILDDGSVVAALQWWQTEQLSTEESSILTSQRLLAQLLKVAVTERGVLPWRPLSLSQHTVVLASPNAHAVVPLCAFSGCAKTRDVWRLHHAMNRYAFELRWQRSLLSTSTLGKTKEAGNAAGTNLRRSPQPPWKKTTANASNSKTPSPSTDAPSLSSMSTSNASLLLREALEAVGTQYTPQAHPRHWLESRLLLARIKARGLCDRLSAQQQQQSDDDDDTAVMVEFAFDKDAPILNVAAEPTRPVPFLSSRDAALRTLPAAVREVCEELLGTLQLFITFFSQRHALLRMILLDLAAVLSTYVGDVRARQRKGTRRGALAAAAAVEAALLPQYEAIVAACTLLAGLVSNMERRVRTGADSFGGYFTDPRLASTESCDTLAFLLQSQWPESLCMAVQQTHDNVGQLRIVPASTNAHQSGGGGLSASSADAISHPFYILPAVQQQLFGITAPAANAGSNSSGRSGSAGSRDQATAIAGGAKRGAAASSSISASSPGAFAATITAAASSMSPLLSVPTLALTFTALSDEISAAQALTPAPAALEHDTIVQLLTAHLQSLSPPVNCTYLCYCDDTRQQLLETIAAVLIQQQPQKGSGGLSGPHRASNVAAKRLGGPGSSGATANAPVRSLVAGTTLEFTEVDVWKALVPPVLLSAVPTDLFSAVGPDTLGAPLYNSVAAAAVSVAGQRSSALPTSFSKKSGQASSTAGRRPREATTAFWRLFLAVSPLHDAAMVEAPMLSTSSSSADAVALLPPAHLVAAANDSNNFGTVGAESAVNAQGVTMVTSGGTTTSALGGGAGAPPGTSSRGRGLARAVGMASNNASTTLPPHRRSIDQDSAMSHTGGSGSIWPPPLASTSSPAACLVPSTNWMLLDQIQQDGLALYQQQQQQQRTDQGVTVLVPVKPTSPTTGIRVHVGGSKAARGINAASTTVGAAPSPSATATHNATRGNEKLAPPGSLDGATPAAAAAQVPTPLRWRSVSLELSDSTVQNLRGHLRAVLRCLLRLKAVDAAVATAEKAHAIHEAAPVTKAASMVVDTPEADAGGGQGDGATRAALAAAVSRAQQTLRSHLAAAGVAMSATNTGSGSGGVGLSGGVGGVSSSYPPTASATGGSTAATSGGSTAPANTAGAMTSSAPFTMRKPPSRLGGNNNADSTLYAQTTTVAATGDHAATHDDLAEAVRARQMADRERQRQQYSEELAEAQTALLRELLEAIVSAAAGPGTAMTVMDEARVELDVQRLMPHCALSTVIVDFLCDWLGGVSAATADCDDGDDTTESAHTFASFNRGSSSGHTSLCFYNVGLHEWMQRVAQYVLEQQQQQRQRTSQSYVS